MILDTLLRPFVWFYKGVCAFFYACFCIVKWAFLGVTFPFVLIFKGFCFIFSGFGLFFSTIGKSFKNLFSNIGSSIKYFFINIGANFKILGGKIKKSFTKLIFNNSIAKNIRNKRELKREVLLIDFNSEDATRSVKKNTYKYVAKNPDGKIIKGYFDAFSKADVHSFLYSEGYEIYSIKTSSFINFAFGEKGSRARIKNKDLIFFLTQLATYVRSGIPLTDAMKILSKQITNNGKQKTYQSIIYELTMGETFSEALNKQGDVFPKLLINMLKASELTGELVETLDDMSAYYSSVEKNRKQVISALTYPTVILIMVIVVLTFMMLYVIPEFVKIYNNSDIPIPGITQVIINISDFLRANVLYVLIGLVVVIVVFKLSYDKIKGFKTAVQWVLMHIPIVNKVLIYNEITMFTKTFSSLLKHNVFITDSMEVLSKITNNEVYKMLIFDAVANLSRGESISLAFKDHWAFPTIAYEMLLTGERTGQLGVMMEKVSEYYQDQQAALVTSIKSLIEPIVICLLAVAVGIILLSVVIPMFSLYEGIDV